MIRRLLPDIVATLLMIAFIAFITAGCASTGSPAYEATVPIRVEVHPAHTAILNVIVQCETRIPDRRSQVRSGEVIRVPACQNATVVVWSRTGMVWRQTVPLRAGWAYDLNIQRPLVHTSILHTSR